MVFSSLLFLFEFLPVTLFIYYISPRVLKNLVLIITSLIFYAWGEPVYIVIMIFTAIFDYLNGLLIEKFRDRKIAAAAIMITSLSVNLGLLSFFKYYGFLVNTINAIFHLHIIVKNLPLPLGISFYSFQSMSYVIDVYRGKVKAQKNIIHYATFVAMFPQLVAGPIIKYIEITKQIGKRKESIILFGEGVELFIIGLSKKVLLANNIGTLWQSVKSTPIEKLSSTTAWIGIMAFTFQIYFDFSGYSDMAMGLGKMFGFNLVKNFDYPYISKSITEFWHRWHMSLGTWFREYLYIPLGGNRKGRLKQYRNIFIVWLLTGLWHGANWNFIFWGLYFGFFVTIEKIFFLKWMNSKPKFIGHIYTLLVVAIGWVFFEFENMIQGIKFIGSMFGFNTNPIIDGRAIYYIYTYGILFIILAVCSTPLVKNIIYYMKEKISAISALAIPAVYLFLIFLSTAYLVNESYNPFLYFRF